MSLACAQLNLSCVRQPQTIVHLLSAVLKLARISLFCEHLEDVLWRLGPALTLRHSGPDSSERRDVDVTLTTSGHRSETLSILNHERDDVVVAILNQVRRPATRSAWRWLARRCCWHRLAGLRAILRLVSNSVAVEAPTFARLEHRFGAVPRLVLTPAIAATHRTDISTSVAVGDLGHRRRLGSLLSRSGANATSESLRPITANTATCVSDSMPVRSTTSLLGAAT